MKQKQNIVKIMAVLLTILPGMCLHSQNSGVRLQKIADNIYHVQNVVGGNIIVSIGDDGVMVVDTGSRPDGVAMIAGSIASVTDKPIRYVIDTHWHSDHVGGNEAFRKLGAVLIAHENVRERMRSEQTMKFFGRKVPASSETAWPDVTFKEEIVLYFNGEEIHIFQKEPGHTDTDCVVHFRKANLFQVGDLYFNGLYPYIGVSSGGSVNGMIAVTRYLAERMDGNTVVVPGHGPVSNKAEFEAYGQMLSVLRDRVAALIGEGKSLEEIVQANPTREYDDIWGKSWMKGDEFTRLLHMDLSGEK